MLALILQTQKDENNVKKGYYVSTYAVCVTGKNYFEAVDKCVHSLVFCVRTARKP